MTTAVKLSVHERVALRLLSGLDEVTIRAIYEPTDGRGVREASYTRAVEAAHDLGLPLPPPRTEAAR